MAEIRATIRGAKTNVTNNVPSTNGLTDTPKDHIATIEVPASASGTTIDLGRIPSNARVMSSSRLFWDDMATSGSPTLSVGLRPVNNNSATTLETAFNSALALSAVSTVNVGSLLIGDPSKIGQRAWEILGLASDPGGLLNVYATIKGAPTVGVSLMPATLTLDLQYKID